jgi:hypothetical protein
VLAQRQQAVIRRGEPSGTTNPRALDLFHRHPSLM